MVFFEKSEETERCSLDFHSIFARFARFARLALTVTPAFVHCRAHVRHWVALTAGLERGSSLAGQSPKRRALPSTVLALRAVPAGRAAVCRDGRPFPCGGLR